MKILLLLGLFVVLGIATCGFVQADTIQTTDASLSPTTVMVESVPPTGPTLATLSNENPNASLQAEPGIIILSFQANDPQTLMINQICKQGWAQSTETRTTKPYNGTLAFGIPTKDECSINISSSGIWTAQVSQFDISNPLKTPVNLSGTGTTVSPPITLEKGEYFFQREETEAASPQYYLTYSNGSYVMDASNTYVQPNFNKISPQIFRIVDVPESGTYFLSAIAEDNPKPWKLSIISVPPAPVMGPGPAIRETV
ncbi:MAG TPA: hypothetical protein VN429_05725 [Methanospirillum sp.]|uniref:hypothetical protein n=1 Tax=Methanospirillum sp. TaxID=45200 RepID=UPI002D172537|nr:hypothetical protein [Methanospirillum sp.]HWQ63896.1 hypothetical protein [Methanospirillum sp.]